MTDSKEPAIAVKTPHRWPWFLVVTVGLNLACAFLFPMFVSDAFTPEAFVISAVPVLWGFSLVFLCRSNRERWVAWLALIGAFYWFLPTIGLPIQYLGR